MAFIEAEILKEAIGSHAAGPAGFGVNYEVDGGAHVDAGQNGVELKLNEQSLERARAQNEGGVNKEVAKTLEPLAKPSKSMSAITRQREMTDNRYQALFAKQKLSSSSERSMTPVPNGRRHDYRAAMAAKNPLLRIRQRHLLQLRQTFDEISKLKKKTVAVNPESLPKQAVEKIVKSAVDKGQQNTAMGSVAAAAQKAGYNHKEWNRWGHTLIDGSFPVAAPRPRA